MNEIGEATDTAMWDFSPIVRYNKVTCTRGESQISVGRHPNAAAGAQELACYLEFGTGPAQVCGMYVTSIINTTEIRVCQHLGEKIMVFLHFVEYLFWAG
jgi:hypothetical protein